MSHVLFIGDASPASTSLSRVHAFIRLGYSVHVVNCKQRHSRLLSKVYWLSGYRILSKRTVSLLESATLKIAVVDLIWIDGGSLINPYVIRYLRRRFPAAKIVLYELDDPFSLRDYFRFSGLRSAIKHFDLCIFPRYESIVDSLCFGSRLSLHWWRGCEPEDYPPSLDSESLSGEFAVFAGTFIKGENRDHFLAHLNELNIPLRLYGNSWHKSPLWPSRLRSIHSGPALSQPFYSKILNQARVSICFLSSGNRDLHTTRTFEIPFSHGLLCAESTSEHRLLFENGYEALLWNDSEECARLISTAIADFPASISISARAYRRVLEMGVTHQDLIRTVFLSLDA